MKIDNGVEALELTVNLMGREQTIFPTLFWDDESVILVDAGFPGLEPQIREAIEKSGVSFNRLSKVVITHQDIDHIGSLQEILAKSQQNIEVLAHEVEKPYIQGDKPLIKAATLAKSKMFESLPEEQRIRLQAVFSNPPKAQVDCLVEDGEVLPYCGGIIVIYTPGHTPGHICLYHKASKTLVTGDALNIVDGQLIGPNPSATHDMALAKVSVRKLAGYDIDTVICYHGGVFRENVNQKLEELAK